MHQSVCGVREPCETLYDGAVRSAINSFHVLPTSLCALVSHKNIHSHIKVADSFGEGSFVENTSVTEIKV